MNEEEEDAAGVRSLRSFLNYFRELYHNVKHPQTIAGYISRLYVTHVYIPSFVLALALAVGALLGRNNPLLLLLYLPIVISFFVAFFPPRKKIGERIWKVACPECGNYIPLAKWDCLCGKKYEGRHLLEGCPQDGTRFGSGEESEFRSADCDECEYELDLYEPYSFEKWSVLEKGEGSDKEFIPIKRETWMHALGTAFSLGGGLTALYLIVRDLSYLSNPVFSLNVMLPIAGLIALGWVLILLEPHLYPEKKFVRNPKYIGEED